MARHSFSTHRINAWTYAHPAAWGAIMGLGFAAATFLANLAMGSKGAMYVVSAVIGGVVFGTLTFLGTRWKRRRLDHLG
jgi:hypothetical protein